MKTLGRRSPVVSCLILLSGLLQKEALVAEAQRIFPLCPCSPTADCDFFFSGFPTYLPQFSVAGGTPGATQTFSTASLLSRFGNAVTSAGAGAPVALTRWCVSSLSLLAQNTSGLPSSSSLANLFSVSGNLLAFTTPSNPAPFQGLCILLPLTSIAVAPSPTGLGNTAAAYPVTRQCVVFQTAPPTGAACSGYVCAANTSA
ncbi:hypothetical protein KFL_003700015 [Klebsormidium nitens]|uniref:Secreted protein n=1 Tax=Klebsormidium nitens TaxID=105231 RepID=A0A1Y1ICI4_KLENI|nr:hypothetical protein KFL_003700015 [Klebsormidium nitens]|eukprot:GAQ87682.1 hypothetical protein KFL_003700015 [Klebsormidium nitens]